ncbi:DMT family transporter [Paracraurococcus lichenis]|uniref:DMT family transporter n=1 Tax=Paracraurococcus lichenis TaxID=3064888 RepID=A0ABT9DU66_9PROT|nr:DMT family transporter [Paracraurococcus sp. LOR1-02]MDO9707437.1 DMT family transporter [Paracraurococcus sp. LOR1-02]
MTDQPRPAAGPAQRVLLGIAFMCLAGLLFPVMSSFAKILGADYSSLQVSWARAFGHILFLLAVFLPRYGLGVLRTRRPGTQVLRSCMLFTSNLCHFFAITFIPIAKAAAISLTAPLIVALLAWPMLGERTTPGRIAALGLGFLGVLIVIRPGTALFHWASLLVVGSATCYAIYQILTRRVAGLDSPETSAIFSSVIGAFGMLLVLPFSWITPQGLFDLALFCGMGVLGAVGHWCVAKALGLAPANIISPFQYFQLLGSVAVGWLVFGDWPDAGIWIGAAVIVSAGLWIGWSQTRKTRAG